ncbi:C-type lectin lectoxin-Thr1-like [Lingula anatina]|uniref:C-type lectin lectoxin-Thr1-like n=1 Tax=Lingula anatina TaxID=7574 RepID=A0A1S3ISG4_LINAN|nr:C-type lectin lectoxin-Thr1-like [Lingula anatina]|eukprot:XP_013401142.1 C-type lectin lectoxin-Thr1-like [Lingula anatina]
MRELKALTWLVVGVVMMFSSVKAADSCCCEGCPDGFVKLGDYCYRFVSQAKSWADARADCFANGGADLISIESARELALVTQYLDLNGGGFSKFWTSGRRMENAEEISKSLDNPIEVSRQFYWGTGFDFSYCQWLPGEPNNHNNNENCVELRFWRGRIAGINDGVCSTANSYICENLHV